MPDRVSRALGWAVGIVAVFAAVAAACGWLWRSRLHVPPGLVVGHRWYPNPWDQGQRADFASTAWYVVIALAAGLVLGVLTVLFSRAPEVVTLVALAAGSALAAWVMLRVGLHGAPPDPAAAARTAADGTRLSGTLTHPGRAALLSFPLAALVPAAVLFLVVAPRADDVPSPNGD
jgi:ribose/xylose/arabinose/galactoside ABC-type transport system permease subunit